MLVNLRDAGQPALHQVEGVALREQHEEAVHGGQQLVVAVKKLKLRNVGSQV